MGHAELRAEEPPMKNVLLNFPMFGLAVATRAALAAVYLITDH